MRGILEILSIMFKIYSMFDRRTPTFLVDLIKGCLFGGSEKSGSLPV